jgi:autotransporter-associated beta strand protein
MKPSPNPFLRSVALAAASLALTVSASATIYQWDGGAATTSWTDANNWNPNGTQAPLGVTGAHRLNITTAQKVIYNYTTATTNYTGDNTPTTGGGRGLVIGSGASARGEMEITNGTFSTVGAPSADIIGNGAGAIGILTVNGGTFLGTNAGTGLGIGLGPASTLNVSSGLARFANLNMNATTATVNLTGGTLEFNNITRTVGSTGNLNLNGGTLKARQDNPAFVTGLSVVNVNSGGAIIDSNGFNITIGNVLKDGGGGGGLTKNSAGTLTLTSVPTYTGATTVNAGTLAYDLATDYSYANTIGGAGSIAKSGAGVMTLTASSGYSGATSVTGGTLTLSGSGAINSSSGIALNGATAKLNASGSTTVSPEVTLTNGTLTGSGTVNAVNVGAATGGIISNNNGTAGAALNIGTLALAGGANLNLFSNGSDTSSALNVTTLTNNSTANAVTLTANNALGWSNGSTYTIVDYGTLGGTGGYNFNKVINNLTARQLGTWADTGSAITLGVTGDTVTWSGLVNGKWTSTAVGGSQNWKTTGGMAATEFLASDDVIFDDSGSTTAIDISDASVSPFSVAFNNSSSNYTISSGGGFGIASGSLTKSGSGSVSLNTVNAYTGATTVNAGTLDVVGSIPSTSGIQINGGTLQVSNGDAIANTRVVSLSNAVGATFKVATSETIGALAGGDATGGHVTIDAGQTLTLASGTQTYAGTIAGAGVLTSSGAVQTLNGGISTSGGVNLTSGRLHLGGSNSYTGQTNISAGAGIVITANNALGAGGTGNETVLGGTGGGVVSGAIGLSGGINYSTNEKIIGAGLGNTSANGAFASVQRGIVQSVSGDNTFAGDIEINSAAGITRFGTQTGSGIRLTLSGKITATSGALILIRAGDADGNFVTLSNTSNSWDTDIQVYTGNNNSAQASGLRLGASNALPTGTSVAGASSSGAANTFDMAGFDQTVNGLSGIYQLRISNSNAARQSVLTLNPVADKGTATTTILDGAGTLRLVKQGNFTQILSGANNYTGSTTIEAGGLMFGQAASLYNGTSAGWTKENVIVNSGATLGLRVGGTGEFTPAQVATIVGNLTTGINNNGLQGGSLLNLEVNAPATYSNVIADSTGTGSGSLGLVKTGGSGLLLDQANTFTGGIALNDGYLYAGHDNAFGAGTVAVNAGAERLTVKNGFNIGNDIVINGGGTVGNGLIQNFNAADGENATVSGDITINANAGAGGHFGSTGIGSTLTLTGSINSSVKVQQRTGTVIFSGGGSYTDLGITGTARLGTDNGLATNATADLGFSGNGVFDLAGFNQSLVGITKNTGGSAIIGNSSTASDSTLTITGTSIYNGAIQDSVSGGSRKVNLHVNGAGGNLTLAGPNTYTGTTTVSGGTLVVNGSISTSSTTVSNGGILQGSGTIGDLTLASGGTLSPGNSPGTLNIDGDVTWQSGAAYNWQMVDALGVAGTGWDTIAITGSLDLGGLSAANPFHLYLWSLSSTGPDVNGDAANFDHASAAWWKLASANGGILGFDASAFSIHSQAINGTAGFSNDLAGGTFSVQVNGNDLNLVFNPYVSAIPEPTTLVGTMIMLASSIGFRRRPGPRARRQAGNRHGHLDQHVDPRT